MFLIKPEFPEGPISAQEIFTFWLDLSAPPTREFCGVMAHFLKNEKLKEFKTEKGRAEYFKYCVKEHRSVVQVFADFEVTNEIPLEELISGIEK